MNRKIKGLGVAIVAVAALSMVATSAVQAAEVHVTHSNHVSIFGQKDVQHALQFTGPSLQTKCTQSDLEGTIPWTSSPQVTAQELTLTATYGQCTCFGLSCTMDMNGCKYTLTGAGTPAQTVDVDIVHCTQTDSKPATQAGGSGITKKIEITGFGGAVVTVPEQTVGGHIFLTNIPEPAAVPHHITADITLQGITYECHNVPGCANTVTTHDGDYTGSETIKATVDTGHDVVTQHNHQYNRYRQDGALKGIIAT